MLWVGDVRVNRATGEIVERFVSAAADAGVDNNAHVVEWLILESIKAHPGCRAERERMHGGWVDPA